MNCFHCGRQIEVIERVGFRDNCDACGRSLHACLNCGWYDPAYNNQCREPQAERVVDKDRANFCEYFSPVKVGASRHLPQPDDIRSKLDALFKKRS
jgi:hypothetical protein